MSNSYHNNIINSFIENIDLFIEELNIIPDVNKTKTNLSIVNTDVDISLQDNLGSRVLIEVKSHKGLLPKFEKKQFPKYNNYFPNAQIYALVGYRNSLNPKDFELIKYK